MPRNNPYDKELYGWRKLLSDAGFILTVVLVVGFIAYVLMQQPGTVRTNFPAVSARVNFAEDSGEFRQFADTVTDAVGMGPDFQASYPTVTKLLNMDETVYTENTPYLIDDGGFMALALPYNNTSNKEVVRLDLLLLPYEADAESIVISAPERYTYQYDRETGVIESETVRQEKFRLGFYTLKVHYDKARSLDFVMTLNSVISDREADSTGLYLAVSGDNSGADSKLKRLDFTSEVTGSLTHTGTVIITFGDLLYDTFEQIKLPLPKSGGMEIGFN